MKAHLRLSYGRTGEVYDGTIWAQIEPTRGFISVLEFEKFSFPRMMSKLAEAIRKYDEVDVTLVRLEVRGSDYKLDSETVKMLRIDPAAAISHMMPESRVVVIRDERKPRSEPPSGLLRAGHETIAAAFGDNLYCTVNGESKAECPGCGRWSVVGTKSFYCNNKQCNIHASGVLTGRAWFVLSTDEVLNLKLPKYYFPRSWNPKRGWISWPELNAMYETFKKEREECLHQIDLKE